MVSTSKDIPNQASSFLLKLGSRALLALVAGLFVVDMMIPDALPFVDEIVLGIITILIARWQSRRTEMRPEPARKPETKNVTPD